MTKYKIDISFDEDKSVNRIYKDFPIENPEILIVTCMKDEGPFILEWLAWHLAAGVNKFLIFTNDCTDGTDVMLDHLQARGIVKHLPNPVLCNPEPAHYQPYALRYFHHMSEYKTADYVISMDVDEFINIKVGEGTLEDLFNVTGDFDALSISEINHGSNGKTSFEKGWVKDLFPAHMTTQPGRNKAVRGVKSIVKLSNKVERIRNHRSDFFPMYDDVCWLDGSGKPFKDFIEDDTINGIDCRGRFDLVSLDHFPLRSLDSYLAKALRGDVVATNKRVSNRYWRLRNLDFHNTSSFDLLDKKSREIYEDLFASDAELMKLQDHACVRHQQNIDVAKTVPEIKEMEEWIIQLEKDREEKRLQAEKEKQDKTNE